MHDKMPLFGDVLDLHLTTPCFQRATGATKLNEVSSRSHAVCIIIVEKCTTSITQGAPEGAWNPRASGAGRPGAENVVAHSIKVCALIQLLM
jgi:hypothetical protein